jgi:hypothetical protein
MGGGGGVRSGVCAGGAVDGGWVAGGGCAGACAKSASGSESLVGAGESDATARLRSAVAAASARGGSASSGDASTVRTWVSSRSARVAAGARDRWVTWITSGLGASWCTLSAVVPFQSRVIRGKWRASQSDLVSGQTSPALRTAGADASLWLASANGAPAVVTVASLLGRGNHETNGRFGALGASAGSLWSGGQSNRLEALAQPENPTTPSTSRANSGVRRTAYPPASTSAFSHPCVPDLSRPGFHRLSSARPACSPAQFGQDRWARSGMIPAFKPNFSFAASGTI